MGNEGSIEPVPYDVDVAWQKVEGKNTPPCAREAHITVLVGRKLYVHGGGSGGTQHSDLFSFDVDEGAWTEHTVPEGQIAPPKSTGACAAVVGTSIYIFGGLNMEQEWLDELYVYDTETNQWKKPQVSGKAPSRRDKHTCCAVGTKIYFFGGFGPQEPETVDGNAPSDEGQAEGEAEEEEEGPSGPCATFGWFNDLHVLDTETMSWDRPTVNGKPPTARAAAALAGVEDKLYLFGGRDSNQRQNDLHVLDLATMTWSLPRITGARPIARSFHTLTAISKQQLVVVGGLSSTTLLLNDVHVYDIETSAWVQPKVAESGQLSPRRFHTTTLVDKTLYVFGGSSEFDPAFNECSTFHNDMYILPIESILAHGPAKLPDSVVGSATVTSSGEVINLTKPFSLSGDIAPTTTLFSFDDSKQGTKRKRDTNEEEGEKEKEDNDEKEKEKD